MENGKSILICHGFNSYSYKFDRFINPLLKLGYKVYSFDAPGHGLSEGKTINVLIYRNIILEVEKRFARVDVILGHSLGGLAGALAMEQLSCNEDRKLVLIAPATETTRSVRHFYGLVALGPRVKKEFEDLIIKLGRNQMEWFSVTRSIQNMKGEVLWIHDTGDHVCPIEDTYPVQERNYKNVRFIITSGLGHSKIYKDEQVKEQLIDFLR